MNTIRYITCPEMFIATRFPTTRDKTSTNTSALHRNKNKNTFSHDPVKKKKNHWQWKKGTDLLAQKQKSERRASLAMHDRSEPMGKLWPPMRDCEVGARNTTGDWCGGMGGRGGGGVVEHRHMPSCKTCNTDIDDDRWTTGLEQFFVVTWHSCKYTGYNETTKRAALINYNTSDYYYQILYTN